MAGAGYQTYDGTHLPYPDNAFHVIFASGVLDHILPTDRISVMREICRVLKPGGIFVVFEHNPVNPLTRLAFSRCMFDDVAVLLNRRTLQKFSAPLPWIS